MKKFAKMSLVAAIAVAGFTSTASAVDLTEAIKGVDISGQFRYRFQERSGDNPLAADNDRTSDVDIELTAKIPVNDNVTAVIKIDNANDDTETSVTKGSVDIEDYYFQYVNGNLTVLAGQQNIPGRLTDGEQGDGIVALYNAGAFTIGAAAFADNTLVDYDLYSVIAMGSVGPVSLLGQYAHLPEGAAALGDIDSYNIKVDGTFGPVTTGVEYVATTVDNLASDDFYTFKAYVAGKIDIVSATLAYVATGDDGSGSLHAVASGSYSGAIETPSEFLLWQMGSSTLAELDAFALDVSVALTDTVSLRAAYADGEVTAAGTDVSEALGQISYKMSPNLSTYVRYSQFELGSTESDRGRIEIKYTF